MKREAAFATSPVTDDFAKLKVSSSGGSSSGNRNDTDIRRSSSW